MLKVFKPWSKSELSEFEKRSQLATTAYKGLKGELLSLARQMNAESVTEIRELAQRQQDATQKYNQLMESIKQLQEQRGMNYTVDDSKALAFEEELTRIVEAHERSMSAKRESVYYGEK